MKELTEQQEKVYKAIDEFIKTNGYSPTVRELCKMVGLRSPATIFVHLMNLGEKGYISQIKGKARTIRILKGMTLKGK